MRDVIENGYAEFERSKREDSDLPQDVTRDLSEGYREMAADEAREAEAEEWAEGTIEDFTRSRTSDPHRRPPVPP